ncbi:MAG: tail fiber domain-containing protein [Bacteroidetes bacterium]|nr:tail fiber domain-containing protein [Bacteroidota bacterium]
MKKLILLLIPFFAFTFLVVISCKDEEVDPVEDCGNGIDDDGDGLVDCDDFDDCIGVDPCGFPSDLRLKEDITPVGYGLSTILQLDPVKFKYMDGTEVHLGLIAQQLQEVLPEVVIDHPASDRDMLAVRYEEIIPVLIQAIQEQQRMIDMLMIQNSEFLGEEAP